MRHGIIVNPGVVNNAHKSMEGFVPSIIYMIYKVSVQKKLSHAISGRLKRNATFTLHAWVFYREMWEMEFLEMSTLDLQKQQLVKQ